MIYANVVDWMEVDKRNKALIERVDRLEQEKAVLIEALKSIEDWMQQDSVAGTGDYDQGLLCGVEDRGFQMNGYAAMRFGYDRALERVSEYIDGPIKEALSGSPPPYVRAEVLEKLLRLTDAVMDSEFGGVSCLDIHGEGNWFDVKRKWSEEARAEIERVKGGI